MKKIVQTGMLVAGIGLLVATGAMSVAAEDSKEALIKARQDFMEAQADDVKAVTAYVKGEGSKESALAAATDLAARGPKISALFVPGTSATDFPGKSFAKPELWTEMDKAKAAWSALQGEEVKLVAVIKDGDQKAVGDQLGVMGKAGCGACHTSYRLKKP